MTDAPGRLSTRATTALRVFLTLLVAAMAVLWFYAFFLAPSGNPDRMEDRTWPEAAQARCQSSRARSPACPRPVKPPPALNGPMI